MANSPANGEHADAHANGINNDQNGVSAEITNGVEGDAGGENGLINGTNGLPVVDATANDVLSGDTSGQQNDPSSGSSTDRSWVTPTELPERTANGTPHPRRTMSRPGESRRASQSSYQTAPTRNDRTSSDNWRANARPVGGSPTQSLASVTPERSGHSGSDNGTFANAPGSVGSSLVGPVVPAGNPVNVYQTTTIVSITTERNNLDTTPNDPAFLAHIANREDLQVYQHQVLPFFAHAVFKMDSTPDMLYFHSIIRSPNHPNAYAAVRKIAFAGFYWFSGIMHNRLSNPNLAFAATLPNLQEMGLTFHTAGLTTSKWGERERLRLERNGEEEKSKELKVLRAAELANKYGLVGLFQCRSLQAIHLECIRSQIVAYHCGNQDSVRPFHDLAQWIRQGFLEATGRAVIVTTRVLSHIE